MTSWVKLSSMSWLGAALPLVFLSWKGWDGFGETIDAAVHRCAAKKSTFVLLLALVGVLYALNINEMVTFDEFNFSLGLRNDLYIGPNHFLSHFMAYLLYFPLHYVTHDTILLREWLNIAMGLLTLWLFRLSLIRMVKDEAIANLSTILLGVSYGIWRFASSAEVYPSMLLMWVACLLQAMRIAQGNDSWKDFFVLSALSNLACLAHDMASLMAPAFLLTFLLAGGKKGKIWAFRYVASGLALLPLFQLYASIMATFISLSEYIDHHMLYANYPDTQPGDYQFSIQKNLFIIPREGFYTMILGIDSSWNARPFWDAFRTVCTYLAATFFLFWAYAQAARNLFRYFFEAEVPFGLVLIVLNWCMIYAFGIHWRPNEEVHHWLLPFSVALLAIGLSAASGNRRKSSAAVLAALLPFVALAASGLYSGNSLKNLARSKSQPWLNALENSDRVVVSDDQSTDVTVRYFRPNVLLSRDFDFMKDSASAGKLVLIHPRESARFDESEFQVAAWPPAPEWLSVTPRKRGK